jgi:hypothetical protein
MGGSFQDIYLSSAKAAVAGFFRKILGKPDFPHITRQPAKFEFIS